MTEARWTLPNQLASVREARSAVRRFVTDLGERRSSTADDAVLLVSELVTNALAHTRQGASDIEIELQAVNGVLHIEVQDHEPRPPVPQDAGPDGEAGRGLLIVDRVSSHWGWATVDGVRKRVWCDVPYGRGAPVP